MRLVNTFDGGTDETNILLSNSGGASGDAFDSTNSGTGGVKVFDNAQAMYGAMSMRLSTSTTSSTSRVNWSTSLGGSKTRLWGRFYFRADTVTSVGRNFVGIRDTVGNVTISRVSLNGTGKLVILNAPAATIAGPSTTVFAAGIWYRIEWSMGIGNPVTNVARLYRGNGTELVEEISGSGDFGTAELNEVAHGQMVASSNVAVGWYDCLEVNDEGYPGPYVRQPAALGVGT